MLSSNFLVLRLFAADLTATQISEISKISRQTINRILQLLRATIVELAEKESYFKSGEIEIDESYFDACRVRGKRGRGAYGKTIAFGMNPSCQFIGITRIRDIYE